MTGRMADMLRRSGGGAPRGGGGARTGGAAEGYEHVVQSGETISTIAQAYGVSVAAILRENNLRDANIIREGQKLFIPKK